MFKNELKIVKTIMFQLVFILYSFSALGQMEVVISGEVKEKETQTTVPYANVLLKTEANNEFVTGAATNEDGRFTLAKVPPGRYILEVTVIGFTVEKQPLFVGKLSEFLDVKTIFITENVTSLNEVTVQNKIEQVSRKMDKKTYALKDNISQSGGSVLQAMQNLPSVTTQDGKVQLRGNDKVTVLIDGKQTALTGFGGQNGLDNIPASAIEKIEIINNPSSKYDANGNAGIINIIYKKNSDKGFNGKVGFTGGLGSLWERKANFPDIRPQYTITPKINPSIALNNRKNNVNIFFQGDYLYTETLNKNEFVNRVYDDGTIINRQTKRNRDTHFVTVKSGLDWNIDDQNSLTISGLYGGEFIIDKGDEPFVNENFQRLYLWRFLEDEIKTTIMATANYQHKFKEAGRKLNIGFNYTFHREDEKYFFENIQPTFTGLDSFILLSDEQVYDFNVDYTKPLKNGKFETGLKLRKRNIPINMQFFQGINSPIDAGAGGWAEYKEIIPAAYANYSFENEAYEAEIGVRMEYVDLNYLVNPDHNTYASDGYNYTEPFPNLRLAYKISDNKKISLFYNRRVDRPNEVDIRIFPKYDDAELIKVGNPALRPQFTNQIELGYKTNWENGSLYTALYHKFANGTITRISSTDGVSNTIYAIFQNAGKSNNSGLEMVFEQDINSWYAFNLNGNVYRNQFDAFSVTNLYPTTNTFSAATKNITSGSLKLNNTLKFKNNINAQVSAVYLAKDIIPQGLIKARFTLDFGIKKTIQKGKGELFLNATDLLNTMATETQILGDGFTYTSNNYAESQVIRLGYSYKF